MKKVITFSLNDTDPANPNFQYYSELPNNDLSALGLIVGNVVPKSGSFTSRTGTISLLKAGHLLM
jgi:hypothetical protein